MSLVRIALITVVCASLSAAAARPRTGEDARPLAAPSPLIRAPERISLNDNRIAAGKRVGRILTIRLEARTAEWHPDGETNPGVVINAFAVEGGPLQVPGPLVRVPEGTEIHAFVHNRLEHATLSMHGMYSRPGNASDANASVAIPAGETRELTFLAGTQGTYYYWAATAPDTQLSQRPGADSQLSGAFVVDPGTGAPAPDRVLLIGFWSKDLQAGQLPNVARIVINGRSWPNTERLTYRVGDSVRLRVINAGAAVHPMHLHGFYFNVNSRGDEREDMIFSRTASAHMVVTERLIPGRTFTLTWKPTRPGNWLFHCHDNAHLQRLGTLDGSPDAPSGANHHVENHAMEMMAGPVMGITVTGKSTDPSGSVSENRRRLRLVARVDTGGTDSEPAFGYTLETGNTTAAAPAPPYLPGPLILLKRGEPVSITVVNQLTEPTAVHWHGIELESYFDGVAGFAGEGKRIAPPIEPGSSFEARFTPPRSGTFIYHTHIDEVRQQQAGLSGPLLVVDSLESYDPQRDIVLLITVPRKAADSAVVLLNGSSSPAPRDMRVGEHYRLRFINVHISRPSMRMRILRDAALLSWRALAKDGMDLPADQAIEGPSEIQMGNGETYDFDFVPSARGDIRLEVTNAVGVVLVSMPIKVQ